MIAAFIPNLSDGTVSVIDTSTNTVINTISISPNPKSVAVSPDGTTVYVGCANPTGGNGTVSVIDSVLNAVIANITVGSNPSGVAITPDGTALYVANSNSSSVSVIDPAE